MSDPTPKVMPSTAADEDLEERPKLPAVGRKDEPLDLIERHARDRLRAWVVGGEPGAPRIGRFTLLKRLGAGGMGTVYSAYDEELDRRIALKFLNPAKADRPDAQHRLLREAQALARLSHPNLVPVYEVGRFEGQVYLAMELVDGMTMRKWADEAPRSWPQMLRAWIEVGRVLSLVHAEGLVHRDVKPDNVIMGDDGRPRLVDFGLAREVGEPGSEPGHPSASARAAISNTWSSGSRLGESVTRTHAVVGTPAYLAPEQRLGETCGPAADQYSFCVALYEGLYDSRPTAALEDEPLVPVPPGRKVPGALRKILSRGLRFRPDDRYASMDALVHALTRVLGRSRRRWTGVGAVVAVGGLAGLISAASAGTSAAVVPCEGVGTELRAVWDDARRAERQQQGEHALVSGMDAFVDEWARARTDACTQTRILGERSIGVMDRRMACLDRIGIEFSEVAETATPRAQRAAFERLGSPSDCLLPGVSNGGVAPPSPSIRDDLDVLYRRVARAPSLAFDDTIAQARTEAYAAVEQAERIGYEPAIVSALIAVGHVETMDFQPVAARSAFERAIDLAEANGALLLKEDALAGLVRVAIDIEQDKQVARRIWHRNAATLRRLGSSNDRSARLFVAFGLIQLLYGDRSGAVGSLRTANVMYADAGPRSTPARASALRTLAELLREQRRNDEALELLRLARQLEQQHGDSVDSWDGTPAAEADLVEGTSLLATGKFEEARIKLQAASDGYAAAHGRSSPDLGYAQVALSQLALNDGQLDDARRHAERADLAIRTGLGHDHPDRVTSLSALGTVAYEQHRVADSVRYFAAVVEIVSAHPETFDVLAVARNQSNLAEALLLDGKLDHAQLLAARALQVERANLPPAHLDMAFPLRTLGEIAVRDERPAEAIEHLQEALAIHEAAHVYPVETARSRAWLARAHQAAGNPSDAARLSAAAAREFDQLGDEYDDDAAAMRALSPSNNP